MNLNKINKLIADKLTTKKDKMKTGKFNNQIGVSIYDDAMMVLISDEDFIFNLNKFERNDINIDNLIREYDYEDGHTTLNMKLLGKTKCIEISNEKCKVYVNMKFLELFDKNCTFKIKGLYSAVYVYENDQLVGIIMPVIERG